MERATDEGRPSPEATRDLVHALSLNVDDCLNLSRERHQFDQADFRLTGGSANVEWQPELPFGPNRECLCLDHVDVVMLPISIRSQLEQPATWPREERPHLLAPNDNLNALAR